MKKILALIILSLFYFSNAFSVTLYDALNQDALIPREVGILQLTIISYMQSEEEIEDRKELLNLYN